MAVVTVTVTISSGGSLSPALDVNGTVAGIVIPTAWTAAAITFQGSVDGTNFFDVYDGALSTVNERTIASANIPTSGGRFLPLSLVDWLSFEQIKIRSGVTASPVNQGADRVITVVLAR